MGFAPGNITVDVDGVEHHPLFCASSMDGMYEDEGIALDRGPLDVWTG